MPNGSRSMKVFRVTDSPNAAGLVETAAELPRPGEGELLIRVCAAGVTPTELAWSTTSHDSAGQKRTGAIPGHEFSGIVVETGEEVFGMNDWYSDGATAEYCLAPASSVAAKPRSLTHAEAASVPISALTAWQGLFDHAYLQAGEHVLVHGGAGAVGIFVVQLAKWHGARVTATASGRDSAFLTGLGADAVIDYKTSRFEEAVRRVDLVFDTVGGDTLARSWDVIGPRGRIITIAADAESATDPRVKQAFFIVEPGRERLARIGGLLDAKQLRALVAAEVPLARAPDAYAGRVVRHGPGKVVLVVA